MPDRWSSEFIGHIIMFARRSCAEWDVKGIETRNFARSIAAELYLSIISCCRLSTRGRLAAWVKVNAKTTRTQETLR